MPVFSSKPHAMHICASVRDWVCVCMFVFVCVCVYLLRYVPYSLFQVPYSLSVYWYIRRIAKCLHVIRFMWRIRLIHRLLITLSNVWNYGFCLWQAHHLIKSIYRKEAKKKLLCSSSYFTECARHETTSERQFCCQWFGLFRVKRIQRMWCVASHTF